MIKLRNFNIEALDMDNIDHYTLVHKLQNDKLTQAYISRNLINWVKSPEGEDFCLGGTYVIRKKNDITIGLFGTMKLTNDGKMELWYDIKSNARGMGNGDRFVGEITPYLIEVVQGLKDVQLKIDKGNIASNKLAVSNGYILNHTELNTNVYNYFNEDDISHNK